MNNRNCWFLFLVALLYFEGCFIQRYKYINIPNQNDALESDINNDGIYCESNTNGYIVVLDIWKPQFIRFIRNMSGDGYTIMEIHGNFLNHESRIFLKKIQRFEKDKTYGIWAYPINEDPVITEVDPSLITKRLRLTGMLILNFSARKKPFFLQLRNPAKPNEIVFSIPIHCK